MYKIDGHKLLQYPGELEQMVEIFKKEGVTSYLEIGCKFGGSLWFVGSQLPSGSRIVGVDLMMWTEQSLRLVEATRKLPAGRAVQLIKGDSRRPDVVREVRKHAPFDACFIDGDHSLAGVKADWENYGPMCRIVCFHDINYRRTPEAEKAIRADRNLAVYAIEVPKFWDGLKAGYRHVEIKLDERDNGIGMLWR